MRRLIAIGLLCAFAPPCQAQEKFQEVRSWNAGDLIRGVTFSPDGKRVLASCSFAYRSAYGHLAAWDAKSGKELFVKEFTGYGPSCAVFTPDGKHIVAGLFDKTVRVLDAETGKELFVMKGHEQSVRCVAVSHDGKRIVSGSTHMLNDDPYDPKASGHLRVWDAATGKQLLALDVKGGVRSVSISPDGKRVATGNESGDQATLTILDLATGKALHTLTDHKKGPVRAVYSPDGKYLASGSFSEGGTLVLREAETGKEVRKLEGDKGWVGSIAFSPDSKRVASNSYETVRVWEVGTGKEIASGTRRDNVRSMAFSPDGKWLVEGDGRHKVTIWALGK